MSSPGIIIMALAIFLVQMHVYHQLQPQLTNSAATDPPPVCLVDCLTRSILTEEEMKPVETAQKGTPCLQMAKESLQITQEALRLAQVLNNNFCNYAYLVSLINKTTKSQ